MRRLTTSTADPRPRPRSSASRTTARLLLMAIAWSSASIVSRADASEPVDFAITTVDGRMVRSDDFRGRWLLVNYWATWCDGCVKEMPLLSRLVDREPRLAVLGITDEKLSTTALETFVAAHPVSYVIAHVDHGALARRTSRDRVRRRRAADQLSARTRRPRRRTLHRRDRSGAPATPHRRSVAMKAARPARRPATRRANA